MYKIMSTDTQKEIYLIWAGQEREGYTNEHKILSYKKNHKPSCKPQF